MTKKTSPSDVFYDIRWRRQTFCAYCNCLASPLLVIKGNRHYGACCKEHQDKINKGEKNMEQCRKNYAQINEELLSVALSDSKKRYLEISKRNKSFVLHQWSKEDRINFVRNLVSSYLNNSKAQAND